MSKDEEPIQCRLKKQDYDKLVALMEYDGDTVSQVVRNCIRLRHGELVKSGEIRPKYYKGDEDLAVTIAKHLFGKVKPSLSADDG